jgi:hypothetical protein
MKAKPDINAFLDGGAGDRSESSPKKRKEVINNFTTVFKGKIHREQKVFRLPLDLINDLKRESFERSIKTGVRVTEAELVEQALREYLYR